MYLYKKIIMNLETATKEELQSELINQKASAYDAIAQKEYWQSQLTAINKNVELITNQLIMYSIIR